MKPFDAAVLGLGALGSATLFQLARRGARVLGVDRFAPPHDLGSSHGETRITREAVGEGRNLSLTARRSHQIWRAIEEESQAPLFGASGLLVLSGAARTSFTHVEDFFANTVAAAREFAIPHELLDAQEVRRRFPQFRLREDELGYWEPGAGFLRPERCVAAQLALARKYGAEVRLDTRVTFESRGDAVRVYAASECYEARTLIIAAGAWLPELLGPPLAQYFRIFRQAMFWFAPPDDNSFSVPQFPVFIWELSGRRQGLYGFPDIDGTGVKMATEQFDTTTRADEVNGGVSQAECRAMHETYVAPFLPTLGGTCLRTSSCLYTVTQDFGFVIDRLPGHDHVILASCCSGHGFKHSASLGEALAELVCDGTSRLDLAPFRLARLSAH